MNAEDCILASARFEPHRIERRFLARRDVLDFEAFDRLFE